MRVQQRLLFATKHVLSRCDCSKTSTSEICKSEGKYYYQLIHVTIQQNIKNVSKN